MAKLIAITTMVNSTMKTRGIIAIVTLLLCAPPSFSQEGFFRIYSSEGNKCSKSCITYADKGYYIVAINNDFYNEGCAKLFKLSPTGDIVGSTIIDEPGSAFSLYNIFRHPTLPDSFVGMGLYSFPDSIPYAFDLSLPYFIQFDGQLNITRRETLEHELFNRKCMLGLKTMLNKDGNIFSEYVNFAPSTPLSDFHRLFVEMSPDGDLLRIVDDPDTVDLQPFGSMSLALFELPSTRETVTFRYGNPELTPGYHGQIHKFIKIHDDYSTEVINESSRFGNDTLSYNVHYISTRYNMLQNSPATVLPLNDSTLLFSMKADEHWYQGWPTLDSNLFITDISSVLFKTDLEGNMKDFLVVNSYNDTIDVVPAASIALTKEDATGHKMIFHCRYSQYNEMWENPNTLTITKLTDDFEILWQRSYTVPEVYLEAHHLLATIDDGCLVTGAITRGCNLPYSFGVREEWFALKLNADGTVGTSEDNLVVRPYACYPNPTHDVLHLQYSPDVQPKQIELYDLQGRLMRTQSKAFESIDMSQLPTGTYTMRVTLEDGKVYSDKVVKE
jgi:hypothetical protein